MFTVFYVTLSQLMLSSPGAKVIFLFIYIFEKEFPIASASLLFLSPKIKPKVYR